MKIEKEEKAEVFKNKGSKRFDHLRHFYQEVKKRISFSNFLITLVSIVMIPFLSSIPSEIVIFNNVTQHNVQMINVNYEP